MTLEQLREKDGWIAEHVTGVDGLLKAWIGNSVVYFDGDEQAYQPTRDKLQAFELLEKCLDKMPKHHELKFCKPSKSSFQVSVQYEDFEPNNNLVVEAETLPLAIVLFAENLFSK